MYHWAYFLIAERPFVYYVPPGGILPIRPPSAYKAKVGVLPWTDRKYTIYRLPKELQGLVLFPGQYSGIEGGTTIMIGANPPATIYMAVDEHNGIAWDRRGWIQVFKAEDDQKVEFGAQGEDRRTAAVYKARLYSTTATIKTIAADIAHFIFVDEGNDIYTL